ncbi:TlpA family protein disulfide reductase [Bacteroidota bacterium]
MMKTIYALLFGILILIPFSSRAQSMYDSLRQVFNEAYLFDKFYMNKREVSFEAAINFELRTIWNDSIRDLAVISVYENSFGYNWTDSSTLNHQIDSIIANSHYTKIRQYALKIKERANMPLTGREISNFGLPDNNEDTVWIESYKGENVIINFWAAWNTASTKDMKKIPGYMNKYKVKILSISLDEEYKDMIRYVRQKEYYWPIVFAGRGSETQYFFKVRHIPKYIVINPEGMIISESFDDLESTIKETIGN